MPFHLKFYLLPYLLYFIYLFFANIRNKKENDNKIDHKLQSAQLHGTTSTTKLYIVKKLKYIK